MEKKPETGTAAVSLALIVFGRDKDGKPHASAFAEADATLATKAADLMGMRTLAVETEEHRSIASQLPLGRVFASGKGFVPFVKKGLYERLSALAGPAITAADDTAPINADAVPEGDGCEASKSAEQRPVSWSEITAGSTVLVHGGGEDGWFEAEVVEAKADDLFTLRWRDWPELPILVRTRSHIALLNPYVPSAAD
ncbi:hypothetical protein ASF60_13020 [Methylobacterium sp. Leaf113]|nr:hypothetical protein ASF60_13020 [Methylobacterium sp. Leaf113]